MNEEATAAAIRGIVAPYRVGLLQIAGAFVDDPEEAVQAAEARLEQIIPGLAYGDDPRHPMASALFNCSAVLALYLVLQEHAVGVHEFGRVALEAIGDYLRSDAGSTSEEAPDVEAFRAAAAASQAGARPGEFVFELLPPGDDRDWGMNVTSCAICHEFSKHGAIDLVPYMCATDDVVSDLRGQGLRRTGTIALGAHQCDFRYHAAGQPLSVAEQYPQRVQLRTT